MSQQKLNEAINTGDIDAVRSLVENNPEVVDVEHEEVLPIHVALNLVAAENRDHIEIAKLVVPKTQNINLLNAEGMTALHLNSMTGDLEIAKILIATGADINIHNPNDGSTPLHLAAMQGKNDVVEFLVDNGAEIDARETKYGITALHFAAVQGHTETLELLLSKGAGLWVEDNEGRAPLALAQQQNQPGSVRVLTQHIEGKVPGEQSELGQALFEAVEHEDARKVRSLLQQGADHGAKNDHGDTPLHRSAFSRNIKCCKVLLKEGADPNDANDDGQTPLEYALDFELRYGVAMMAAFGSMMGAVSETFSDKRVKPLLRVFKKNGAKKPSNLSPQSWI